MLKKTRLLLCLGALSGTIWAGTFATFSDSGTATSTFTAGEIDLLVSGEVDDAYAFTTIEMGNMKPGDVKYAPLTVANNDSLAFTYTMATVATNADTKALRDKLQLGVRIVADTATCDSAGVGYAASLTTVTAEAALSAAAIASRPLAVGTNEVLCFKVLLPSDSDNSYQAATTTATFTFAATQS